MGISFAPGLAQQLGGGGELDQLGEGIAHLINPNYKFQQAMRQAIATNPKLAQELADQEYTNPGFLKNMGLGPLGENIAKLPESPDASIIRTHREQILGIKGGQLDNEATKTKNEGKIEKGASDQLKNDPEALVDAARKAIGLGSMAQNREQKAKATQEEFQASIDTALGPHAKEIAEAQLGKYQNEISQNAIDRTNLESTLKDMPKLQGMNLTQLYRDMRSGKNPEKIQELFNIPGFKNALPFIQQVINSEDALKTRLLVERQRQDALNERSKDREETRLEFLAAQQANKTGKGDVKSWLTALNDGGAVKSAQDKLEKTPDQMTQDDWGLISVGEAQAQQQEMAKASVESRKALAAEREKKVASGTSTDLRNDIVSLNSLINKNAPASVINLEVGNLNQKLATRNKQTGRNIVAQYGKIDSGHSFIPNKTGLYFTENGKKIDDAEANTYTKSDVIDGTKVNASKQTQELSAEEKNFLADWNKASATNKAEAIGNGIKNNKLYKSLLDKGLIK